MRGHQSKEGRTGERTISSLDLRELGAGEKKKIQNKTKRMRPYTYVVRKRWGRLMRGKQGAEREFRLYTGRSSALLGGNRGEISGN